MTVLLDKITIERFKKVKKAKLPLSDLNILVGSNSSGKSSIIQAVHFAACVMRQAPRVDRKKTSTISVEALDYLPSNFYKLLCHRQEWGNNTGTPSSKMKLEFTSDDENIEASCEIRSARNAGISVKGAVPQALVNTLRKKDRFFSAYIPGISGIPNREEKRTQKVVQKSCSFGDSNVVLRNVLLLLKERDEKNIRIIEKLVSELVGTLTINISHDETQDLFIECDISFDRVSRPLELMGTGHLQLIQIFSYMLLFKPGVLLVDEPDTHLHPDVQERLPDLLAKFAKALGTRIILTTHSPFLLRGAPLNANVFWLDDGHIATYSREAAELTLGWGAFGKRILIISEDSNTTLLKMLVEQWPELDRQIAFVPGYGYSNLITPQQAAELKEALGGKFQILVHRDRDSLLDDEIKQLRERYCDNGIYLWITDDSDIEAYFCQPTSISTISSVELEKAETLVDNVLRDNAGPILDQFRKQRRAHNQELYAEGGSPENDDAWEAVQSRQLKGAKGKFVLKQLKARNGQQDWTDENLSRTKFHPKLALSLYEICSAIIRE